MTRFYPFGKDNGGVSFDSVHETCNNNTATIINFNIILDKDFDVKKVKEIIRECMISRPEPIEQ